MPPSAHLSTLLRALQQPTSYQDTPRLLSSSAYLLTLLSNPLNTSLLTSQLLHAPALWAAQPDLRFCVRWLGLFQSVALELTRRDDVDNGGRKEKERLDVFTPTELWEQERQQTHTRLGRDEWVEAVMRGVAGVGRGEAWKQALVLGGLLMGFMRDGEEGLSRVARRKLGVALVESINVAALEVQGVEDVGGHAVALVLCYVFELLQEGERGMLVWDVSGKCGIGCELMLIMSRDSCLSSLNLHSLRAKGIEVDTSLLISITMSFKYPAASLAGR